MLKTATIALVPSTSGAISIEYGQYKVRDSNDNQNFDIEVTVVESNEMVSTTSPESSKPKPSANFIKKYLESVNEDVEPITSGLVLFTKKPSVKIRLDNTITIKRFKDFWAKEEIVDIIHQFAKQHTNNHELNLDYINSWGENNIK